MQIEILSNSLEETVGIGERIGQHLSLGDVICLDGNLGAGKTAFVSGVAKGLGVTEHVTSPTFTIVNEYEGRIPFFHFDVYRVYDPDELYDVGFEEYFYRGGAICIEWSSLIKEILPEKRVNVLISNVNDNYSKRLLTFTWEKGNISNELEQCLEGFK